MKTSKIEMLTASLSIVALIFIGTACYLAAIESNKDTIDYLTLGLGFALFATFVEKCKA